MSNRPNNVLQSTLLGNLNDKFVNIDNGMFTLHFFYDLPELIAKYFSYILMNFFSKERYWQIFLRKLLTLFEK